MYRYSVDNTVIYTPDDLSLFRESPFALWMERLTLENPDHGIPADIDSEEPLQSIERQDEIVDTLRAEGRNVALVDWDQAEPVRRAATAAAMQDGADFIVNGALAVGEHGGTANLMMRTSGFSELGDFLYVPCDTQGQATFESAFRLCFLADLLQDVQGQLPPQLLLIRGDADVVPLQCEDHIHYYRAVKKRFVEAMQSFRKHRMPDPSLSSHFGRWSECAGEVLKQRALSEEAAERQQLEALERLEDAVEKNGSNPIEADTHESVDESSEEISQVAEPLDAEMGTASELEVAASDAIESTVDSAEELPLELHEEHEEEVEIEAVEAVEAVAVQELQVASSGRAQATQESTAEPIARPEVALAASAGQTLAEQALKLQPGSFKTGNGPGRTPNLARFPRPVAQSDSTEEELSPRRRAADIALQNLEFIGSGPEMPFDEDVPSPAEPCDGLHVAEAPPPNLRHLLPEENVSSARYPERRLASLPDLEPPAPALLPPEDHSESRAESRAEPITPAARKPHPLDSNGFNTRPSSVVDLDSAPPPELSPVTVSSYLDEADEQQEKPANSYFSSRAESRRKSLIERDDLDKPPQPARPPRKPGDEPPWAPSRTFSDSLITSERLDDF